MDIGVAYGVIGALIGSLVTLFVSFMSLGSARFNKATNGALTGRLDKIDAAISTNRDMVTDGQRDVVKTNGELLIELTRIATILDERLPHQQAARF